MTKVTGTFAIGRFSIFLPNFLQKQEKSSLQTGKNLVS
jgi:hypothetical protein